MTEKQLSILVAAIEIFSEKGYQATTTSEIAKKAQVAEGTIFRHFKTKKDLLLAIPIFLASTPLSRTFLRDINRVIDTNSITLEDFLRKIILNRQRFASENLPILKVIIQELPFHPELREKIGEMIFCPATKKLMEAIDRFKKEGQIVDKPSPIIANLIITTVFGYFFSKHIAMLPLKWEEASEIDDLIEYIIKGIKG